MPFGLKNTRATFQMTMNAILTSVQWQFSLVYLDDVVVFSKSTVNHIKQIQCVLQLLYKVGVTPKLKKLKFFVENIDNAGHITKPGHFKLAERTKDAAEKLETSTTQT